MNTQFAYIQLLAGLSLYCLRFSEVIYQFHSNVMLLYKSLTKHKMVHSVETPLYNIFIDHIHLFTWSSSGNKVLFTKLGYEFKLH